MKSTRKKKHFRAGRGKWQEKERGREKKYKGIKKKMKEENDESARVEDGVRGSGGLGINGE